MKLKVYNTEQFKRNIRRYILFSLVLLAVLVASLFYNKGSSSIIGTGVLVLVIGVYFYFHILHQGKIIDLEITEKGLLIDNKNFARINFQGFVLEMEKKNLRIKNIVFVLAKSHYIFTLVNDNEEQLEEFTNTLSSYTQQLSDFEQTGLEKFYRRIKL